MKPKQNAVLLVAIGLIVSGCGSSNSNSAASATTSTTSSSLTCPTGFTYNGSTCVGGSTSDSSSSCVSISSSIPFYGSGAQIGASNSIILGLLPSNSESYGVLTVGSTGSVSGSSYSAGSTGSLAVGTLQMTEGSGAVSGTLTLSSYYQEVIYEEVMSSSNFDSETGTSPCVSGLAFDGFLLTNESSYSGSLYIYLDGTEHGLEVQF